MPMGDKCSKLKKNCNLVNEIFRSVIENTKPANALFCRGSPVSSPGILVVHRTIDGRLADG